MYPGHWASVAPDKPAAINANTGEVLDYATLNTRSAQLAHYFKAQGLGVGDHVALFMENNLRFFEVAWAAYRSGLYLTCINRYLTAEEAAYIVNDCDASILISSAARGTVADALREPCARVKAFLMTDGALAGWTDYDAALADQPATAPPEEPAGDSMLYSSGTTGRPKGIKRPLSGESIRAGTRISQALAAQYHFTEKSVYLSPAPLYHAAPFAYSIGAQSLGATVVMMEKFDPETALGHIERLRRHPQPVGAYHVRAHAQAPRNRARPVRPPHPSGRHSRCGPRCPVAVKQQMIDWWGQVLYEYYAGTEGNGSTFITSEEWLKHPGSVGRAANGVVHICDEDGAELPTGEAGLVYFEQPARPFEYHKAPEKTASSVPAPLP